MLNKRGYSFGAQYPIHYDKGKGGKWEVFDARTDRVIADGLDEWEAVGRAHKENGSPSVDIAGIDSTP